MLYTKMRNRYLSDIKDSETVSSKQLKIKARDNVWMDHQQDGEWFVLKGQKGEGKKEER